MIFSFPSTSILQDKKRFKQISDQYPKSFPPNNATFLGKTKAGKNIRQTETNPKVKKNLKIKLLIIL